MLKVVKINKGITKRIILSKRESILITDAFWWPSFRHRRLWPTELSGWDWAATEFVASCRGRCFGPPPAVATWLGANPKGADCG